MSVLKLVGANRYMNKKASPSVILRGCLTNDITDEGLLASLLAASTTDKLGNVHKMFEAVEVTTAVDTAPVVEVREEKEPAKKRAPARSRKT